VPVNPSAARLEVGDTPRRNQRSRGGEVPVERRARRRRGGRRQSLGATRRAAASARVLLAEHAPARPAARASPQAPPRASRRGGELRTAAPVRPRPLSARKEQQAGSSPPSSSQEHADGNVIPVTEARRGGGHPTVRYPPGEPVSNTRRGRACPACLLRYMHEDDVRPRENARRCFDRSYGRAPASISSGSTRRAAADGRAEAGRGRQQLTGMRPALHSFRGHGDAGRTADHRAT
jgi:hypothetical protein